MKSSFKTLLDAQWKNVAPAVSIRAGEDPGQTVFWEYRISPPFPLPWPPDGNLRLVYYAYAGGSSPSRLVDGEFVAVPWGRLEVNPRGTGEPKFIRLSNELREIGVQGVRPLTSEEVAIFQKGEAVEDLLAALTSLADIQEKDVRMLRQYFCAWCSFNGHIAEEICPSHRPFFLWLGCE